MTSRWLSPAKQRRLTALPRCATRATGCRWPAISLPAQVPIGSYNVDVKLFADGNLIAHTNSAFEIVKVGFEQFVVNAARNYGLLYGFATALMALCTGWIASVAFRRD